MITTVTMNPSLELSVRVPALRPGELNQTGDSRTDLSGKGMNVSIVLRELGLATICTGVNYDGNGQLLEDYLEMHSICRKFATAHGNIRTNIKVYDEATGQMTAINHSGYPVAPSVLEEYFRQLLDCAAHSRIMVFSGQIATGADDAVYRRSIRAVRAKHKDMLFVVDAEGSPLREALRQKPTLVKPNLYELETLFRCKIHTREQALAVCRRVLEKGISIVCLSMGGQGAMLVGRQGAFYAPALPVEVRGLTGAGDSMVAGLCKGLLEDAALPDLLRYGVAAASASLLREGALLCRRPDFERLLPQVQVESLAAEAPLPQPAAPRRAAKPKKP